MNEKKIYLSRETLVLLSICSLDMLSSAYLFHHGMATEANPVLRASAEAGLFPFISAKTLSFVPALAVAEWYRHQNPRFIRNLLRTACALYAGIYLLMVGGQFYG